MKFIQTKNPAFVTHTDDPKRYADPDDVLAAYRITMQGEKQYKQDEGEPPSWSIHVKDYCDVIGGIVTPEGYQVGWYFHHCVVPVVSKGDE